MSGFESILASMRAAYGDLDQPYEVCAEAYRKAMQRQAQDHLLGGYRRKADLLRDAEIRRLLGEWVSECEPELVYGPNGIAGLTAAGERFSDGLVPIVVHAKTIEIALTIGDHKVGSVAIAMPLEECRRRERKSVADPMASYLARWLA